VIIHRPSFYFLWTVVQDQVEAIRYKMKGLASSGSRPIVRGGLGHRGVQQTGVLAAVIVSGRAWAWAYQVLKVAAARPFAENTVHGPGLLIGPSPIPAGSTHVN